VKILFITSTRIGDAVLSTGLLAWLIERHPGAALTIACGPPAAPLFEAVPGLERLIVLRKRPFDLHWPALWRACVGRRWDLVVDLRRSLLPWLLWARSRRRLPKPGAPLHRVALIARTLDLDPPPSPRLWTSPAHERAAARLLAGAPGTEGPLLAVGPAANWAAKTWPAARFAELIRRLTGPRGALAGARVAVICGPGETETARPVLTAVPETQRFALDAEPLLTVFTLLRRAALFVGNDSGLMHMAAAAGAPTLGLFGPSDERLYAPWGEHAAVARGAESAQELLARAEAGAQGGLMESLEVAAVEAAARELLARTESAARSP
jgi:ADP-heptose:LPS heptosyltransferase